VGYVEGRTIAIEYRLSKGLPPRSPGWPFSGTRAIRATPSCCEGGRHRYRGLGSPSGRQAGDQHHPYRLRHHERPCRRGRRVQPRAARRQHHRTVQHGPGGGGEAAGAAQQAEGAARALGLQLHVLQAGSPSEIDAAFAALRSERTNAALVLRDTLFLAQRTQIAALAAKSWLPVVSGFREEAEAGGLMAYGASVPFQYRGAADYVDKILKGAKPADLPVQQPTKFDLVINLKTAKALSLTIPPSLLQRADQVIE
jgi:ABC transporter substrate binding protein